MVYISSHDHIHMFVEYGKKQKDKQSDLNFWHLIPLTLSTSEDLYQIKKKKNLYSPWEGGEWKEISKISHNKKHIIIDMFMLDM